ncbi:MAG: 3-phosphoshikimate 1-carboxyvinyltransferase [Candidatus Izemoplasmatales bacterium]|nr:3-phosphoshikimate 1-carboxyvinyltransferase [Candidatus Izemoplasmatales bacterium]
MNVLIQPKQLTGTVVVPPSKSQSHRAIIAASLSKGKSVISNITYSEDIVATIGAMEKLGVKFIKNTHQLIVSGVGRVSISDDNFVDCNESGSTLRFVIPIFSISKEKIVFTGKRSLFKRPMSVYEDLFKNLGLGFQQNEDSIIISGSLTAGLYEIPGNISSQFISGLMFALPLVKGDSKIKIIGTLESKQYIDMTIDTLHQFQIQVIEKDNEYIIKGSQTYHPSNVTIEGDYSQLAFFGVLGTISGEVSCKNIPFNSKQPDRKIIDYILTMGGNISQNDNILIFKQSNTKGTIIDVSQSPDIAPILAILAGLSEGQTSIINAGRLKMKESNRLVSTYETLIQLGVPVEMGDDYLIIQGVKEFSGGTFDSYNDHRIVMSVAIASSRATHPIIIKNAEAINKSYPNFFEDLEKLTAIITYIEE